MNITEKDIMVGDWVQYGEIILQVEYDPSEHSEMNNYTEGC